MATPRSQRIAIWIIAIVLTIGTIGSFFVLILANKNSEEQNARLQTEQAAYQKEYDAYQDKLDAQGDALSKQYLAKFSAYKSQVSKFDSTAVTKLTTKDIVEGTGEKITGESAYSAYYIGWNPKGVIFDSSLSDGGKSLKNPLVVNPGGVIEGWSEGTEGMKVGGVRMLTIPADKAYGDQAQGEDIPANTPLKFIVMVIPTPEKIEEPQMSDELWQHLLNQYGTN